MDMIAWGLGFLNSQQKTSASIAVTFNRTDPDTQIVTSVPLLAVVASPLVIPPTSSGAPQDPLKAERSFTVLASDLAIDGVPVTPNATDTITEIIAGVTSIYKVTQPSSAGPYFQYETGYRGPEARITIHTKFTGVTS